jgi:flagellin-specific chaperone FliS
MDPKHGAGLKAYRENQIAGMSPGELVLTTFDVAIQGCETGNRDRAQTALEELIGGLDFAYQEMSGQFLVLYDWILRLIIENRFSEAQRCLIELRETWAQVVDCEPKADSVHGDGKADAA